MKIFNEFIIGGAITFHGGTSVLAYAWGNNIHVQKINNVISSTEVPDFNAFNNVFLASFLPTEQSNLVILETSWDQFNILYVHDFGNLIWQPYFDLLFTKYVLFMD